MDDKLTHMTLQSTSNNDIYNYTVSIQLSPGEHFYHFKLRDEDDVLRLPYKGEFRVVNDSDDESSDQDKDKNDPLDQINEKFANVRNKELIQALLICLIVLGIMFFSTYRRYLKLIRRR
jgi:hypothetical protein